MSINISSLFISKDELLSRVVVSSAGLIRQAYDASNFYINRDDKEYLFTSPCYKTKAFVGDYVIEKRMVIGKEMNYYDDENNDVNAGTCRIYTITNGNKLVPIPANEYLKIGLKLMYGNERVHHHQIAHFSHFISLLDKVNDENHLIISNRLEMLGTLVNTYFNPNFFEQIDIVKHLDTSTIKGILHSYQNPNIADISDMNNLHNLRIIDSENNTYRHVNDIDFEVGETYLVVKPSTVPTYGYLAKPNNYVFYKVI